MQNLFQNATNVSDYKYGGLRACFKKLCNDTGISPKSGEYTLKHLRKAKAESIFMEA